MRGSIDLDKSHCQLDLLPRPPDRGFAPHDGGIAGTSNIYRNHTSDGAVDSEGSGEHHRVEVTRKLDNWSIVLCFASASELQSWMKSIFDVQQRKATFSPLLRHASAGAFGSVTGSGSASITKVNYGREFDDDEDEGNDDNGGAGLRSPISSSSSSRTHFRAFSESLVGRGSRAIASSGNDWLDVVLGSPGSRRRRNISGGTEHLVSRANANNRSGLPQLTDEDHQRPPRHRRRRPRRNRGTLDPHLPPESSSRGGVPSSWADDNRNCEDERRGGERSRSSQLEARLGKASERLVGLPRGGRAAGGAGINSSLDEYGAFTTAHSSIYEGWTRGLQAHGWGRMIGAHGDLVEGWWEHDVLEGTAEHNSREEGWTYRGGFVAGERHGPGRLVTSEGDIWECEWRHGAVAPGVSGTHTCPDGDLYQGGCAPSAENPGVPCRAGHGRLRRRDGEQVETHFRAGRAVDGAKGVVRFRNGAIFFGQLQGARPHG